MPAAARLIDANANRASEAMRVLEDLGRLVLDRADLGGSIKRCRHELRGLVPGDWATASRDVRGDVGTGLSTDSEGQRSGLYDVAEAAAARLGEALRVIEETLKITGGESGSVEALRYAMYDHAAAVCTALGSRRRQQWPLCLLLSINACKLPWQDVVRGALDGGTTCVQVREKSMDDAALLEHVQSVIELARPRGVAVIVNDRVDLALAADADGAHLGDTDLSIADARRVAGGQLLLGATAHDLGTAILASEAGADYLGVGSMYASATKDVPVGGPPLLASIINRLPGTPHLAIGGIDRQHLPELAEAGCRGVAVCASICGADDPAAAATELRGELVVS